MLGLIVSWVGYNLYDNAYGLWYSKSKSYNFFFRYEWFAKYLLLERYIPEHFNSLIMGPSYSDMMIPQQLDHSMFYNLSVAGASVLEQKQLLTQALKYGQYEMLIFCINPVSCQSNDSKYQANTKTLKHETLYGKMAFKQLSYKIGMFNDKKLKHQYLSSTHGMLVLDIPDQVIKTFKEKYTDYTDQPTQSNPHAITFDPQAFVEMAQLFQIARDNQIKIVAYYNPYYKGMMQIDFGPMAWKNFKDQSLPLFNERDLVIDLNAPQYDRLTEDISHFTDAHLSESGSELLIEILNEEIHDWLKQGS